MINVAERSIDVEPIQEEIGQIDRTWSEYVEFILDTMDYIQLHQEDLKEFQELSTKLFHEFEKKEKNPTEFYDQVELLNQKGEILLQSCAKNENPIERTLEKINRDYDRLTLDQRKVTTSPSPLTAELRHHIDEIDGAMNELAELLVSSSDELVTAQPMKLTEQLMENGALESELERRKSVLEQFQSTIEHLKDLTDGNDENASIEKLKEKFQSLNEHWTIMKRANDLRRENLLLTESCATKFWSDQSDLSSSFDRLQRALNELRPRSTSEEHIHGENEKFHRLFDEFLVEEEKLRFLLHHDAVQLLSLISANRTECEEIEQSVQQLKDDCQHLRDLFERSKNEIDRAMIESAEFNGKLQKVSNWFDDPSISSAINDENQFEHIRTFKEHLDCKYFDLIHLKQDFNDIEQRRNSIEEDKVKFVEEQLEQIDTKWSELNGKVQEQ